MKSLEKLLTKFRVGTALFFLLSLFGLIRVLKQAVPGHYRVFTSAAHALWNQSEAYGTDFGTGVGYWFYSPSCGLFFFKFFELFPEKVGLTLYSLGSVAVLYWGIRRFLRVLKADPANGAFATKAPLLRELTFLIVAPILLLGVTASKPEIIMTGILLWSSSLLLANRKIDASAFFLSMILIWKYQPLPSLGLLALAWIFARRNYRFPLALTAFSFLWILAPYAVLPYWIVNGYYGELGSTFAAFITGAWMNFDNLFTFLVHGLRLDLSYGFTQPISAVVAILFATGLWKNRRDSFPTLTLFALAFGALFTATLSPLSQNNSYILLTPMIITSLGIVLGERQRANMTTRVSFIVLVLILSFAYSDVIPKTTKELFREIGVKPLALFVYAWVLWANEIKRLPQSAIPHERASS